MKLIILLHMRLIDSCSTYTELFLPFGMTEIMKSWVCVLMSLFNALRIVDMRVLQVVVCWYHLMDSACPNNFSLHSLGTYTPAMKSIYTTTQRSSQKHPRWVIHALYKNWAIKISLCALANFDGKLGYTN